MHVHVSVHFKDCDLPTIIFVLTGNIGHGKGDETSGIDIIRVYLKSVDSLCYT